MLAQQKRCAKCGARKSLDGFYRDAGAKGGYRSCCKICALTRSTQWNKAHPEKTRESTRKWRNTRLDETRAITRKWNKDNPEKRREYALRRKRKLQAVNYAKLSELFGTTCLDCGREYPMQIFDYHHLDPATKTRQLSVVGWVWDTVRVYVQGCVQLCPTCHRLRHFSERGVC